MKNTITNYLEKKEETSGLRSNGVNNSILKKWKMSRSRWTRIVKGATPDLIEAKHIADFFECEISDLWPDLKKKVPA